MDSESDASISVKEHDDDISVESSSTNDQNLNQDWFSTLAASCVIVFGIYCCFIDRSAAPKLCFCFAFFRIKDPDYGAADEWQGGGGRQSSRAVRAALLSVRTIASHGMMNFAYSSYANAIEKVHPSVCQP